MKTILYAMLFLLIIGIFYIVSIWTDNNLEFWLSQFKGYEVHVPFYISVAIAIVCNAFIVAANIVSELIRIII